MSSSLRRSIRFRIEKRLSGDRRYRLDTFLALAAMRQWSKDDLIFDVGANDGRTILRWRRHLGASRVFAFEPVESTFRTLSERTGNMPDVRRFQIGLGEKAERRTIYLHEGSAMNSFYQDRANTDRSEEVDVERLDDVIARENVNKVELLKIDAEGHDLEVLKGARRSLEEGKFDIIQVEAGFDVPGKSDANLWDFNEFLRPYGYFLHVITNQCQGLIPVQARKAPEGQSFSGMLSYCDAIFVRG